MNRLACHADYNVDGQLTSADLAEFQADYAAATPVPGPAGYAVPAVITMLEPSDPRPPAPYDELGYKVDFDQDGMITPADLSEFVNAYFAGC